MKKSQKRPKKGGKNCPRDQSKDLSPQKTGGWGGKSEGWGEVLVGSQGGLTSLLLKAHRSWQRKKTPATSENFDMKGSCQKENCRVPANLGRKTKVRQDLNADALSNQEGERGTWRGRMTVRGRVKESKDEICSGGAVGDSIDNRTSKERVKERKK